MGTIILLGAGAMMVGGAASGLGADDGHTAARAKLAEALRKDFRFDPTLDRSPRLAEKPDVILSPLLVTEDKVDRAAGQAVDEKTQRFKDEEFTWRKGGTLKRIGHAKLGLLPRPDLNGWALFDYSF